MDDADTHAPSPADREPDASLATALADVHVAIARAADEVDLMAALAGILDRRGPARSELCLFSHDEHGAAAMLAVTVTRVDGVTTRDDTHATPVSAAPLASLWFAAPNDTLEIADLDDLALDISADDRQALAPYRAVTILPLHSHRHRSWQGYIRLLWTAPHRPGAEDRFVDRVLMQTVAAAIASRRTLRAHEAAIAETQALRSAQARLHAAGSLTELLAVVAEIAGAHACAAWLARVDPDEAGAPAWLEILATWGDATVHPGARFHVPSLARRPPDGEVNQFVGDLEHAADLDPGVRQLGHTFRLRAAATLPLRWRGRFSGMIMLGWTGVHAFTPRERRLHTALARQASVVFDSRQLLEQTRDALREHQKQRATLETLLDNLPVGVVVRAVAADRPPLINRQSRELGRDLVGRSLFYPGTDTPIPEARWPIVRALQSGERVAGAAELLASDGGRRMIESVAAPVRDEHGVITHVISVSTEVTARRRAEAERLAMQEALIRAQASALAERSTPLLPISDEILVLPVIGTIDDTRGQQIMETLVGLGGHRRVRVAILDITGAGTLDARGAHALVGAARALRLRGALPILTGFTADTAAVLTAAGVDLSGLIVRGTLQAGIAHARRLVVRR